MTSEATVYRLSDVIEIVGGGTPKRKVEEYWNGDIPWLSVVDFNSDERFVDDTAEKITELGLQESSTKLLEAGKVIISARGTVGCLAQLTVPMAFNQSCYGLSGKCGVLDNDYLYYLMHMKVAELRQKTHGAVFDTITRETFNYIEVQVPGLGTQEKIAKVLGSFDYKIQLNNQTNQTLEQMAQAIFKSWFVDFEPVKAKIAALEAGGSEDDALLVAMQAIAGSALFATDTADADAQTQLARLQTEHPEQYATLRATAELFPSAMQESELGGIPEGWVVSQIGDEVTVVGGGTPSTKNPEFWEGGTISWTTPKDLSNQVDKVLIDTDRRITQAGLNRISSGLLPVDTVLMSSRAPVGYLALAKTPIAVNQGYIAMKCEQTLSSEFVIQWCEANMAEIKNRASGTTFAEISKKSFNIIPVVVPQESLISVYSKHVHQLYLKIEMNVRENKSLAELRDTLLPKLLTGELVTVGDND